MKNFIYILLMCLVGISVPQELPQQDICVESVASDIQPSLTVGITKEVELIRVEASKEAANVIVVAEEEPEIEAEEDTNDYIYIRCTGYILKGTTASGKYTYDGCAATCNEWFGKEIDLYSVNSDGTVGEYIKTCVADDKGGELISNGSRIDIWYDSLEEAKAFTNKYGDYVYIVVKGE